MIIFLRKPSDPYAVFVSAMLAVLGPALTRPPDSLVTAPYSVQMALVGVATLGNALLILFLHSFPDGTFTPRWVRYLAFGYAIFVFFWYFGPLFIGQSLAWPSTTLPALFMVTWLLTGITTQVYRYRRVFAPTQQQQAKWLLYGFVGAGIGFITFVYILPAVTPIVLSAGPARLAYIVLGVPILYFSVLLVPAAIAASILRFRLWDIDRLINRTLVYSLVMVVLSLFYFGVISLITQVIFANSTEPPVLSIAAATLAVSFLFNPLRKGTQEVVDRRFFRSRYDSSRILDAIDETLRRQVDLDDLLPELLNVVRQALQPELVSVFLYRPDKNPASMIPGQNLTNFEDDQLAYSFLLANQQPVAFDELDFETPAFSELYDLGYRMISPMINSGELVGVFALGPRRSEQNYSSGDRRLLGLLGTQVAPALRAALMARHQRLVALQQQRTETELRVARDVQRTLLPDELPELPGWQLEFHYQPARALGGDFYDVFPLADGRMGLVIGDVSDKGVPAALVMASTKSMLRTVARAGASPGQVLAEVNDLLAGDIPRNMFITALYIVIDPETGEAIFSNAGQNLPFACMGGEVIQLKARGMPLGLMPDLPYEEQRATILPGAGVLFFSDGLVEAHNNNGDMFGSPRVRQWLGDNHEEGKIIPRLMGELNNFTGDDHEQEDDITLLVLTRAPDGGRT